MTKTVNNIYFYYIYFFKHKTIKRHKNCNSSVALNSMLKNKFDQITCENQIILDRKCSSLVLHKIYQMIASSL